MKPYYEDDAVTLYHGDCLDVLRADILGYDYRLGYFPPRFPDASADSVVTDPPYGLEFMGKTWDRFDCDAPSFPNERRARSAAFGEWCESWTTECIRVLKPGGHLLAFGGTRTWHRLACAVEDAGFEVRDSIAWLYGSGFPKSLDVSKAIDKLDASEERTARAREFQSWLRKHLTPQQVNAATGTDMGHHLTTHPTQPAVATADLFDRLRPLLPEVPERIEELVTQRTVESENFKRREVVGTARMVDTSRSRLGFAGATYGGDGSSRDVALTAAHTEEAAAWQGWGTALKPAFEPIIVARKPLTGTVAANVLEHGTGALNIDGCRVAGDVPATTQGQSTNAGSIYGADQRHLREFTPNDAGRWPANVVLDGSQAAVLDEQSGQLTSGANPTRRGSDKFRDAYGDFTGQEECVAHRGADSGGASRFFPTFRYEAKAPASERPFYYRPTCECEDAWPTHTPSAVRATDGTTAPASSSTSKSGSATTGDPSPTATRSTTSTATSSTTTPTTSSPSPRPTTSASTPAANSETATGGSRAALAASSSPLAPVTGTSAVRGGRSTDDAARATSQGWSATSVCGECGAPTRREAHATVKPLDLMRWLVRLVTPPGGTVLEPFAGSGTTVEACIVEGFHCLAIEREADYLPLITQRINRRRDPIAYMKAAGEDAGLLGLDFGEPA